MTSNTLFAVQPVSSKRHSKNSSFEFASTMFTNE